MRRRHHACAGSRRRRLWFDPNRVDLKSFNDDVTEDALFFVPVLEGTSARYTIMITVKDQPITVDEEGQITSLIMPYDPEGDSEPTTPLEACEGVPIVDMEDEGYDAFWPHEDVGLLPDGETACSMTCR